MATRPGHRFSHPGLYAAGECPEPNQLSPEINNPDTMKTNILKNKLSALLCGVAGLTEPGDVTRNRTAPRTTSRRVAAAIAMLVVMTLVTDGWAQSYHWSTFAGNIGGSGYSDGTGSAARFSRPMGVAVDAAGNVFVADTHNHTIRKVTPSGIVTTFAGTEGTSGSGNDTGAAARFFYPAGVAVDGVGNLYVADSYNQMIRKVTSDGVVTTFAGQTQDQGASDGTGGLARFRFPSAVAVDGGGNVYVADTSNHTIRKITSAGVVTTLAGSPTVSGTVDGTGSGARFNRPGGVAVDGGGNVYVADTENHTIRKVTPAGVVTTLAGSPLSTGTANGAGAAARFRAF
jgi:sugar lactone lactonase YvrE